MPPLPPAGLRRVEIGCRDLDRSLDFYQRLLGFRLMVDTPRPAGRSRLLTSGTVVLELVEVGAEGNQGGWVNDDLSAAGSGVLGPRRLVLDGAPDGVPVRWGGGL